MEWSENLSTGIARLDEQHKRLFETVSHYRAALEDGGGEGTYATLLSFLDRYTRAHFSIEEQCMTSCRCPAAESNHQAHRDFTEFLQRYDERYRTTGFTFDDAQSLGDFMENWLTDHVSRIDAQLRSCV